jgi:asparagine synthase (glutamine-hydrolysing)
MCGIAGYIGGKQIPEVRIKETLRLMQNRGPDSQNYKHYDEGMFQVYLLHSRLSIIDLHERSNQPFISGDCALIYNGEMYNYVEVREQLAKRGQTFQTTSDTEVVLKGYLAYGEACVHQYEGMWSFAVYDRPACRLFLSRDRFGEKPLYYLETGDGVYFASEIKALRSLSGKHLEINYQHICRYLVNGYKSLYKGEDQFFRDIKLLGHGCNLTVDTSLKINITKYWEPVIEQRPMSSQEAIDGTRERLLESVRLRLRADVPLAFCLSGGVDSAALVSIAAKVWGCDVATFSILDPDERYNEYDNIRATIEDVGCKNTLVELKPSGMYKRLEDLICYHDSPISTISYLVHSYLSEAISNNGYKVAFSGTSADELFTGYYDHFILHLYEMRNHPEFANSLSNWQEYIKPIVRNPHLQNSRLYIDNPAFRDHIYFKNKEFSKMLKKEYDEEYSENIYCDSLLRNRMLNELFTEVTPVILHEDDLNSMKYSVENRSPYLDSKLFEFAYSIPNEHLIQYGYAKYVLREAMKGILNDKVRLDRRKKGFNASIHSVIDFTNKNDYEKLLSDSPVYDMVRKEAIENIVQEPSLPNSYSKFMFSFINAKIFIEQNS